MPLMQIFRVCAIDDNSPFAIEHWVELQRFQPLNVSHNRRHLLVVGAGLCVSLPTGFDAILLTKL